MKLRSAVGAVLLAGCATFTFAQSQTEVTRTVVKPVIVTGEVIRYEPGQTIVIRSVDRGEVSYMLTPSLTIPTDVRVGRTVSVYTEPGEGGATVVKKVTTSVTPAGEVKQTTEETRTSPTGETTTTTKTTITGTVQAFEAGKSITLTRPDGTQVTYVINDTSQLPAGLAIGKRVIIYPATVTSPDGQVVQRVVYVTEKKKHH
jgi:hypothetical protein